MSYYTNREAVCSDETKGVYAYVTQDEDSGDPRKDWEHPATEMVTSHRRYRLGDRQTDDLNNAWMEDIEESLGGEEITCTKCNQPIEWSYMRDRWVHSPRTWYSTDWQERFRDFLDEDHEGSPDLSQVIMLPLYLYDHSGLSMSTGSFGDPWDSGMVGYIWTTLDRAREDIISNATDDQVRVKAVEVMEAEVAEYDQWLTGDVWFVDVYHNDELVDSLAGIYGADYAKEVAEELFEGYLTELRDDDLADIAATEGGAI